MSDTDVRYRSQGLRNTMQSIRQNSSNETPRQLSGMLGDLPTSGIVRYPRLTGRMWLPAKSGGNNSRYQLATQSLCNADADIGCNYQHAYCEQDREPSRRLDYEPRGFAACVAKPPNGPPEPR
eukprot:2320378-Rhodomonas_salina.1